MQAVFTYAEHRHPITVREERRQAEDGKVSGHFEVSTYSTEEGRTEVLGIFPFEYRSGGSPVPLAVVLAVGRADDLALREYRRLNGTYPTCSRTGARI